MKWRATIFAGMAGLMLPVSLAAQTAADSSPDIRTEQALGLRYLYGSAEAASISRQSYRALTAYVRDKAKHRPKDGVVLASGAGADDPRFEPCGKKRPAVIFDADETLIWNIGSARWLAEHGLTFDPKVWAWWEATGAGKVLPVPGAVEAVRAIEAAGARVIVISNRDIASPDVPDGDNHWKATAAALKAAGLGDFVLNDNLFLRGTGPDRSSKDARRAAVSARYCVIAMAGDQLGDFAQLFNDSKLSGKERKALAERPAFADLWGNGWFLLPNPLYGPWDRAAFGDVFDDAQKW